jgi:LCP family protein required for cell wall assembly
MIGVPPGRRRTRGPAAVVAGLLALLMLAGPGDEPAALSLVRLETASAVDLGDGVVWVLALGSDADPGQDLMSGNADAIQLVGLDVDARRAVAIGVPRDSYVDYPGAAAKDRINQGLTEGGPELVARLVSQLTGISPQYVVTSGPELFARMVDAIGGLTVRSRYAFVDTERGLTVRRGLNRFDGEEAAAFAGSREPLPRSDFDRAANQQALLRAILDQVRKGQDELGFLESGALAAFRGLETDNLGPAEVYRFAHAITEIDPARVTTCVIRGRPFRTSAGAEVIIPDEAQARRLARDARDDARIDGACA